VHCVVIRAALCGSNLWLLEIGSTSNPRWVFYLLRSIIFIYYELQNIYCFTNLNQLYVDYDLFWVLLNILKLWWCWNTCMICGVRMNCVTVCGGWEFCRLGLHCKWLWFLVWVIKLGHDALHAYQYNFGLG